MGRHRTSMRTWDLALPIKKEQGPKYSTVRSVENTSENSSGRANFAWSPIRAATIACATGRAWRAQWWARRGYACDVVFAAREVCLRRDARYVLRQRACVVHVACAAWYPPRALCGARDACLLRSRVRKASRYPNPKSLSP